MSLRVKISARKKVIALYTLLALFLLSVRSLNGTGKNSEVNNYVNTTCTDRDARIFIYDLPQLKKYQSALKNSQFATENIIHERLLKSKARPMDPLSADFFFVPIYPMGVVYKYKKAGETQKVALFDSLKSYVPSNLQVTPCVQETYDEKWCQRQQYLAGFLKYAISLLQFWNNENSDSRHIFVFPGGDQQNMFPNWRELIGRSIHLLVEGHYGKYLSSRKDKRTQEWRKFLDIVIPGGGDYDTMKPYRERSVRNIFLSYCGNTIGSKEREKVPAFIQVLKKRRENIIFQEACSRSQFLQNLRTSRYCLSPAGSTPWTARLYGAIAQLCVPILFNTDIFVVPYGFDAIFNNISIRVSLNDNFDYIIRNITEEDYEKKYNNLVAARSKFMLLYSFPELLKKLSNIKCKTKSTNFRLEGKI